jgi:hypothetical protein
MMGTPRQGILISTSLSSRLSGRALTRSALPGAFDRAGDFSVDHPVRFPKTSVKRHRVNLL